MNRSVLASSGRVVEGVVAFGVDVVEFPIRVMIIMNSALFILFVTAKVQFKGWLLGTVRLLLGMYPWSPLCAYTPNPMKDWLGLALMA
jgi:hypothetical protein